MKYECDICKDDGLCLNNTKNPDYDDDFFGSDLYDCADYYNQYVSVVFEMVVEYEVVVPPDGVCSMYTAGTGVVCHKAP